MRGSIAVLFALLWLAELAYLGEYFVRGGLWDRLALGAILLIAIPVTWKLLRIGADYVWFNR